jgi:hypothetical protein
MSKRKRIKRPDHAPDPLVRYERVIYIPVRLHHKDEQGKLQEIKTNEAND